MSEEDYSKILRKPKPFHKNISDKIDRQAEAILKLAMLDERIWGGQEDVRQFVNSCFNNPTGAIKLRQDECVSSFFTIKAHRYGTLENFTSRGRNYHVAIDPLRNTVAEKIEVIQQDTLSIQEILTGSDIP